MLSTSETITCNHFDVKIMIWWFERTKIAKQFSSFQRRSVIVAITYSKVHWLASAAIF